MDGPDDDRRRIAGGQSPNQEWETLARKLEAARCNFLVKPCVRFRGQTGEQATLFVADPSGNALEFKAFHSPDGIFAHAPRC